MLIGLCYTKPGYNGDIVMSAFKEGLVAHGDSFVDIKYFDNTKSIENCDAIFMISYPDLGASGIRLCDELPELHRKTINQNSTINNFRKQIYKTARLHGKRILCLDSGVIGFKRIQKADENYYQIGWDNIKGLGNYGNKNSNSDRWDSLNIDASPVFYREKGDVLLFGQVRFGVGSQHIDMHSWYRHVVDQIYSINTKQPILFRMHPNSKDHPLAGKGKFKIKYSERKELINDFNTSKLSISFSSHAIVESIISGLPSFCFSKLSMGYPLFHIDSISQAVNILNKQEFPSQQDIMQWLYDLAYTQWSIAEIRSGEAWQHLKNIHTEGNYENVRFEDLLSKL